MGTYIDSGQIREAIAKKYCAPACATFFEVANGTGMRANRWIDALTMGIWPSRGLDFTGFEIKVSKSDWKRELAQPAKVEDGVFKFCTGWVIVTPPGIVDQAELPKTWGLMEFDGKVLKTIVARPPLKPKPPTNEFVAAILRRALEVNDRMVARSVEERLKKQAEEIDERVKSEVDRRMRRYNNYLESFETLERNLGCKVTEYSFDPIEVGRALKLIKDAGIVRSYQGISRLAKELTEAATKLEAAMKFFEETAPKVPAPKDAKDE